MYFLGVTFKANVDDVRESPALEIVQKYLSKGVNKVLVFDPYVDEVEGVNMSSLETVLSVSDILVLLVDHSEFTSIAQEQLNGKILIDTRGLWAAQ